MLDSVMVCCLLLLRSAFVFRRPLDTGGAAPPRCPAQAMPLPRAYIARCLPAPHGYADRAPPASVRRSPPVGIGRVYPSGSTIRGPCPSVPPACRPEKPRSTKKATTVRHPLMVQTRRRPRGCDRSSVVSTLPITFSTAEMIRCRRVNRSADRFCRPSSRWSATSRQRSVFSGAGQIGLLATKTEGVGGRRARRLNRQLVVESTRSFGDHVPTP